MNYRNYAAALLFTAFAFSAVPAAAQGYAGVLPAERGASALPDNSALPFMSNQLGAGDSSHATVTGGGDDGDAGGVSMDDGSDQDVANGDDGGNGEEPADITDIYGLNGDTVLSEEKQASQESGAKAGFMAAFADDDKNDLNPQYDPLPENMYRAMEGGAKDPGEQRRQRIQRAVKAAEEQRDKEVEAMNAERTRDHQIRAQAELDRIRGMQEEAMERVRAAAAGRDYIPADGQNVDDAGETQEMAEYSEDAADGDSATDSSSSDDGSGTE